MKFTPTQMDGVWLIEPEPRRDERGYFARTYCEEEFTQHDLNTRWVQQNQTMTKNEGSVRGMHWQADPKPEAKLVRCVAGRVLDVLVDVRPDSASFGQWQAIELSAQNMHALYIPHGFAHGFQCLEDSCELFYLMSEFYYGDLARGLRCDDPQVGIVWLLQELA
jgi:dTDP-4-dehydrorhamnose 3,5-epimerase